jgi:hypothetical protein
LAGKDLKDKEQGTVAYAGADEETEARRKEGRWVPKTEREWEKWKPSLWSKHCTRS